jgi:hypothetical protein
MEAGTHRKAKSNLARPMAYDSLSPRMPLCSFSVMTFAPVIPAKAGIQWRNDSRLSFATRLDTRLRGYDGIGCGVGLVDSGEVGGDGV